MPVRVAVPDECAIVTAGLEVIFEPYSERVRLVQLDNMGTTHVDVVLYDHSADTAADRKNLSRLGARLVAFGWDQDPKSVTAAIADGAFDYICKATSPEEMVEALERIHQNHPVKPESPAEGISRHWSDEDPALSARESDVLALICQGLSNAEIAEQLHIGINTVKTHTRSIYHKAGVITRSQAVIWALSHGFESPSDTRQRM